MVADAGIKQAIREAAETADWRSAADALDLRKLPPTRWRPQMRKLLPTRLPLPKAAMQQRLPKRLHVD